jgi:hypothetical protein
MGPTAALVDVSDQGTAECVAIFLCLLCSPFLLFIAAMWWHCVSVQSVAKGPLSFVSMIREYGWIGSVGGTILTRKYRIKRRKNLYQWHIIHHTSKRRGLGANPGFRGEKPGTISPSYGKAYLPTLQHWLLSISSVWMIHIYTLTSTSGKAGVSKNVGRKIIFLGISLRHWEVCLALPVYAILWLMKRWCC